MKLTKLALSLLVGIGSGCTTAPSLVSTSDLPNCFDSNYEKERGLFTIKTLVGRQVSQQCLLTVGPRGDVASASALAAGTYKVYLANGGGGGAGGTFLGFAGGGGGGGAGAVEALMTVVLTEGVYKLTIGAGGPGGTAGSPVRAGIGGGTGWAGSPSNIVRVVTGEVVAGTPGADTYARDSRSQSERSAGKIDAHGGSARGKQAAAAHAVRSNPTLAPAAATAILPFARCDPAKTGLVASATAALARHRKIWMGRGGALEDRRLVSPEN